MREHQELVFISQNGMVQRTAVRGINRYGRDAQGVRVMNLREGDEVSAVALVVESEADDGRRRAADGAASAGADGSPRAADDADGSTRPARGPRPTTRRSTPPEVDRTTSSRSVRSPSPRFATLARPEKGGGPKLSDSYYGTLEVPGR